MVTALKGVGKEEREMVLNSMNCCLSLPWCVTSCSSSCSLCFPRPCPHTSSPLSPSASPLAPPAYSSFLSAHPLSRTSIHTHYCYKYKYRCYYYCCCCHYCYYCFCCCCMCVAACTLHSSSYWHPIWLCLLHATLQHRVDGEREKEGRREKGGAVHCMCIDTAQDERGKKEQKGEAARSEHPLLTNDMSH